LGDVDRAKKELRLLKEVVEDDVVEDVVEDPVGNQVEVIKIIYTTRSIGKTRSATSVAS
jgi:hypothetical protein